MLSTLGEAICRSKGRRPIEIQQRTVTHKHEHGTWHRYDARSSRMSGGIDGKVFFPSPALCVWALSLLLLKWRHKKYTRTLTVPVTVDVDDLLDIDVQRKVPVIPEEETITISNKVN